MAASKVFDEVEDELSCSLCFEQYDNGTRAPKVLPCQHTFCYLCLVRYTESSHERGLPCPTCKRRANVDENGIQTLPNNLTIVSLIGRMARMSVAEDKSRDQQSKQENRTDEKAFCKQHNKNAENICLTCNIVLCSKCIVVMAREKMHVGHKIVELDECFICAKHELKEYSFAKVTTSVKGCMTFVASYGDCFKTMEKTINNTADEAIQHVQDWRSSSLDKVKAAEGKTLSELKGYLRNLQMQETILQSQIAQTTASIEMKDIKSFLPPTRLIQEAQLLIGKCENLQKESEFELHFEQSQVAEIKLRPVSIQRRHTGYVTSSKHKSGRMCTSCRSHFRGSIVILKSGLCPNCHERWG